MGSHLEQESQQLNGGRLQTLYQVNDMLKQVVAEGLDIDVILPRVLRVALQELDAFSGSIIVIDEDQEPQHAWLITEDELEENDSPFLKKVVDEGLLGWTIRHQETAVIDDTREDDRWLPRTGHPTASEAWSAVCTPLVVRSRVVGAITVTCPGAGEFDQRAVDLLEAIANPAASTIESARLYKESQERAEQLAALVQATAAISNTLDLEAVLRGVAQQMVRLAGVDACVIFDRDPQTHVLVPRVLHACLSAGDRLRGVVGLQPATISLIQRALERSRPQQAQPAEPTGKESDQAALAAAGVRAALAIPLLGHEETIGLALLLDLQDAHHFDEQEISFTQMLANQAAIAIQNARLYEHTQHQLKASALLNEASKVINSSLDTSAILQSLLAQMNELLNAEAISIALVDQQRNELVYEVAEGIGSEKIVGLRLPSNQGVSGWVMEHGAPALVPDTSKDPRFYKRGDERTGHDTRAMICAPLQVKGQVLGTIQAINPRRGTFSEDELQLLVNLANLASSALANAQQFAHTQAAEARYMSLFEDSVNPILLTDPEGQIVEANRRACEFLGYTHDELLALSISNLHDHDGAMMKLPPLEAIGYDAVEMFTGRIHTSGELKIPVEVYVKCTRSGDTELLQWIYRDISQEIELQEMREDLMAMLVHDLQSPLGNIISSLELLRYELPPQSDPVLLSIVDIAARSGGRLQTLIRSLLDITRLEAGHPITDTEFVSLPDLVRDAGEIVQPTLQRRQAFMVLEVAPDLDPVYGDSDMIRRIFVNLLDNASKYTPEGKQVTIELAPVEGEDRVLARVSDQGPGIPPAARETIFEKFRRLQSRGAPKGMGLGLAFCRLAVEAHGGEIWVDEAPGGGARFNFTLPTAEFSELTS